MIITFTSGNEDRPDFAGTVEWIGPVEPINAINYDTWIDTAVE